MSSSQNLISKSPDTQAKVPAPAAPTVSGGQPPGPSGVGTFTAGVGANTIVALLAVMEDMMKISNLYGELLVDQLKSQASVATSLGSFAKQQADDQATQMEWQGWMGVAGGGLTGAIGLGGMISSPKVGDLDSEIQGTKAMRDYMDNPEEAPSRVASNTTTEEDAPQGATEKDIKALKNRSGNELTKDSDSVKNKIKSKIGFKKAQTGVTEDDIRTSDRFKTDRETIGLLKDDDTQMEDLKSTYDEKIKDLTTKRQSIANEHGTKWNTRVQTASALNTALGGFGTAYGSQYTAQAGEEEAAKDTANAALQTAQGITSETRQQTDTYLNKSSEVVQLIAGISQANKLIGS